MPPAELAFALLALLVTPGPTNTLLALAGAEKGLRGALRLIPAEAAAYLITTVPLAIIGAEVLSALPMLRTVVTLAAALWVAYLAIRLWRLPAPGADSGEVTASRVFTTTLLNPKGLIIGLVLLPSSDGLHWRMAIFALLIGAVAMGWALLGSLLGSAGRSQAETSTSIIRRAAACWLGMLSVGLLAAAGLH